MTPREIYDIWAPEGCIWSRWTKPVLYSHLKPEHNDVNVFVRSENINWVPDRSERTAIVIDLPGKNSINLGLKLTEKEYWPVPLFNSCPPTEGEPLVKLREIMVLINKGSEILKEVQEPTNFLPAFLLDSNRMQGKPVPKVFDNRWQTFPQDFPSANFLISQNIKNIIVVKKDLVPPMEDLYHVLFRWQEAGITIKEFDNEFDASPKTINLKKPWSYKSMWYRAMTMIGLRRSDAGGFGAVVPEPGSSGGGFS